jgi:hypothetical protein
MKQGGKKERSFLKFTIKKLVFFAAIIAIAGISVVIILTFEQGSSIGDIFDISVRSVSVVQEGEDKRLEFTFIIDNISNQNLTDLQISAQPCKEVSKYLEFGGGIVPLGEYSLLTKEDAVHSNGAYGVECSASLKIIESEEVTEQEILGYCNEVTLYLKWDGGEETHILDTTMFS